MVGSWPGHAKGPDTWLLHMPRPKRPMSQIFCRHSAGWGYPSQLAPTEATCSRLGASFPSLLSQGGASVDREIRRTLIGALPSGSRPHSPGHLGPIRALCRGLLAPKGPLASRLEVCSSWLGGGGQPGLARTQASRPGGFGSRMGEARTPAGCGREPVHRTRQPKRAYVSSQPWFHSSN